MQINSLGSHHADAHQVTECIHNHGEKKKTGGAQAAPKQVTAQQQRTEVELLQNGQFSLSAWVKRLLSGGKGLFGKLWGSESVQTTVNKTEAGTQIGVEQVMAQLSAPGEEQKLTTNGEKMVNPYFVEVNNNSPTTTNLWQKMRSKVQNITGNLKKQFSGRNSFQTKQEQPKEDLRRHSRYHKEDQQIECILTDDSYLMDSYDRKGEYSKLSTKK